MVDMVDMVDGKLNTQISSLSYYPFYVTSLIMYVSLTYDIYMISEKKSFEMGKATILQILVYGAVFANLANVL